MLSFLKFGVKWAVCGPARVHALESDLGDSVLARGSSPRPRETHPRSREFTCPVSLCGSARPPSRWKRFPKHCTDTHCETQTWISGRSHEAKRVLLWLLLIWQAGGHWERVTDGFEVDVHCLCLARILSFWYLIQIQYTFNCTELCFSKMLNHPSTGS